MSSQHREPICDSFSCSQPSDPICRSCPALVTWPLLSPSSSNLLHLSSPTHCCCAPKNQGAGWVRMYSHWDVLCGWCPNFNRKQSTAPLNSPRWSLGLGPRYHGHGVTLIPDGQGPVQPVPTCTLCRTNSGEHRGFNTYFSLSGVKTSNWFVQRGWLFLLGDLIEKLIFQKDGERSESFPKSE